jgi:hypothetical protein
MTKNSISVGRMVGSFVFALGIAGLTAFFLPDFWRGWGTILLGVCIIGYALYRGPASMSSSPSDGRMIYGFSLACGLIFAAAGIAHLIYP